MWKVILASLLSIITANTIYGYIGGNGFAVMADRTYFQFTGVLMACFMMWMFGYENNHKR